MSAIIICPKTGRQCQSSGCVAPCATAVEILDIPAFLRKWPDTPAAADQKAAQPSLAEHRAPETGSRAAAAPTAQALVAAQAEDPGLWFVAQTAPEAYLQAALRALHAAVECPASPPAMSEERGTPETDALANEYGTRAERMPDAISLAEGKQFIREMTKRLADLARRLERERDEAREERDRAQQFHDAAENRATDAESQLAEARQENERLRQNYAGYCVAVVKMGVTSFGTLDEGLAQLANVISKG